MEWGRGCGWTPWIGFRLLILIVNCLFVTYALTEIHGPLVIYIDLGSCNTIKGPVLAGASVSYIHNSGRVHSDGYVGDGAYYSPR